MLGILISLKWRAIKYEFEQSCSATAMILILCKTFTQEVIFSIWVEKKFSILIQMYNGHLKYFYWTYYLSYYGFPQKADSNKDWGAVVNLESGPVSHSGGDWELRQGREGSQARCANDQLTMLRTWGSDWPSTVGDGVEDASVLSHLKEETMVAFIETPMSLDGVCSWGINSTDLSSRSAHILCLL